MTAFLIALLVQDDLTIQRRIQTMTIDASYQEAKLEEVVDYLRDLASINILVDRDAAAKGVTVTLKAKGIRVRTLLNLICRSNDLGYLVKDGILTITTKEKAVGDVTLQIYDISDTVWRIPNFPAGEIEFGNEGGPIVTPPPPEEPSADLSDAIVDIVKTFTGALAWDDNPKASISHQRGLLIVKQTREVHRKIQEILSQLRALR